MPRLSHCTGDCVMQNRADVFARTGDDVYRAPQRFGIVRWIAAGKARICVFSDPEHCDMGSMCVPGKLGVRRLGTGSNPLHVLQRHRDAASIVTVIDNVPLNLAASEGCLMHDRLARSYTATSSFVNNGDVCSYNVRTKITGTQQCRCSMTAL